MSFRKHPTQELAAAKAGTSGRNACRVERDAILLSKDLRRYWRSRPDPFAAVCEPEVVPLLKNAPQLMVITILRKLQEEHPERFRVHLP